MQSLLFVELFCFFAYFWLKQGQTLGMLAWRLKLQTLDGRPLRPRAVIYRFLGALLSFATLGLGYFWILFDPARRSWADHFSGTLMVHTTGHRPQHLMRAFAAHATRRNPQAPSSQHRVTGISTASSGGRS